MTKPNLDEYRRLEAQLYILRSEGRDLEPQADVLIDHLNALWQQLTPVERDCARQEAAARHLPTRPQ